MVKLFVLRAPQRSPSGAMRRSVLVGSFATLLGAPFAVSWVAPCVVSSVVSSVAWSVSTTALAAPSEGAPLPAELGKDDARAVRAVVEAQLKALAADDATLAFFHASSAIQQQFGDAAAFERMVRRTYPMLIRPTSTSFYRPTSRRGVVVQPVMFRDRDGRVWRADYQLRRQTDQRWRIEGCQVVPIDDASTT